MNFRVLCPLVAGFIVATLSPPAGATGSDLFCTVESIPVSATCPFSCPKSGRMRATEVNGERHILWISSPAPPLLNTARSIDGEAWTYSTISLPGIPTTLDVHGSLAVVGYGTNMRFLRLVDGAWITEETLPTGHAQQVRSLAIGVLDGVERVVVGSTAASFTAPSGSGEASIFRRDGTWVMETTLPPPPGLPRLNAFGFSVAIDGGRVVIGTPSGISIEQAPVAVHELVDGAWVHASSVSRPAWLEGPFGMALALNGETLAIQVANESSNGPGSVQVHQRQTDQQKNVSWIPMALLQGEGAGQWFGSDLDMIADGDAVRLAIGITRVGAPWPGVDGPVLTAGWLYRLEQGVVLAATRLRAPTPGGPDWNARHVALVPDGGGDVWVALNAPAQLGFSTFSIVERDSADCDGDGIPDACAIIDDPSLDGDLNGVPDSCESITGDLDGNGVVDGADLGIMLAAWGDCPNGSTCAADLNGDGTIDGADLGALLGTWTP